MCERCAALEAKVELWRAVASMNRDTVEAQQRVYNEELHRFTERVQKLETTLSRIGGGRRK